MWFGRPWPAGRQIRPRIRRSNRYTSGSRPACLSFIRLKMGRSLRARLESRDILQATLPQVVPASRRLRGAGRPVAARLDDADRGARDPRSRRLSPPAAARRRNRKTISTTTPSCSRRASVRRCRGSFSTSRPSALEAALESLTDAHRQVILLRTFEELSFPEIAQVLGKSEDACRMLFARAMTALTLALAKATAAS